MTYIDKRGWKFRVMQGLGESNWKARYCKAEWNNKWRCVAVLPWRETAWDAEDDLKAYAEKHGMRALPDEA